MAGLYFEEFEVGREFHHEFSRTVTEMDNTTIGNLGMTDVKFPKPVFHGDTLRAHTRIISKRASKSRPTQGIVEFEHTMTNQRGEVVASCRRTGLMHCKPKA